mmetsp:Transcript_19711/g.21926  ORF Transcript_19711/g.21926 Transcript_19711/m.21926 type:complete len:102 (+) Transcript_19711:1-306(+)
MPLGPVGAKPLAILDTSTMTNKRDELVRYTGVRRFDKCFEAIGVKYRPEHKWHSFPDMDLGDILVFDSNSTPHTAIPGDSNSPPRRSVETRCMFVNLKKES